MGELQPAPSTRSWTVVALSVDIEGGSAAPVLLDGMEIVVWRSASGHLRAWEDRCPHRGMRLSFGFVRGERLACLYHGWQYDTAGACVSIPAHPDLAPPPTICTTTYPCVELGGLVLVDLSRACAEPPALPRLTPVRTLVAMSTVAALADLLGADPTAMLSQVAGPENAQLLVALQQLDEARTALHIAILGEAAEDVLHTVCTWSEMMRSRAETQLAA